MYTNLIKMSKVLELPKIIIKNEQRVIFSGQETKVAFYILTGKVTNEDSSLFNSSYYKSGEVVCIRDFLGSKTYSRNHKAIAGTILLGMTVEIFKEIFFPMIDLLGLCLNY